MTRPLRRPLIGLVTHDIHSTGGVSAVVAFLCQVIERAGLYDIKIISLETSARSKIGVALTRPSSWFRGLQTVSDFWCGRPVTHVGSFVSELEFQRYRSRATLTTLLADCDLIQVVCGSPAWAWSVCSLNKPVLVQCATRVFIERRCIERETSFSPKVLFRRGMTIIVDQLERKAVQAVDGIQLENQWMLDYVKRLNMQRNPLIEYAPPGVDAGYFQPVFLRQLDDRPYILCVGRLSDPRKNIDLLLEAYASLPDSLKEKTELVLAGSSAPDRAFWSRTDQLQLSHCVRFVSRPNAAELLHLYQEATVFVLPSNEEGLGVVILEAMACGIPVISTRSGGPDNIINDGVDGFLVECNDCLAIADRLEQLLSDNLLNRCMGEAARETILSRYQTDVAGKRFLDMYQAFLD